MPRNKKERKRKKENGKEKKERKEKVKEQRRHTLRDRRDKHQNQIVENVSRKPSLWTLYVPLETDRVLLVSQRNVDGLMKTNPARCENGLGKGVHFFCWRIDVMAICT